MFLLRERRANVAYSPNDTTFFVCLFVLLKCKLGHLFEEDWLAYMSSAASICIWLASEIIPYRYWIGLCSDSRYLFMPKNDQNVVACRLIYDWDSELTGSSITCALLKVWQGRHLAAKQINNQEVMWWENSRPDQTNQLVVQVVLLILNFKKNYKLATVAWNKGE